MFTPLLRFVLVLGLLIPSLLHGAATAEQVLRRLDQVATLIESSSGAQQVERANQPPALAKRATARALHKLASDAYRSNDLASATQLLDDATHDMMDAVRQSAPEQVTSDKAQRDFQSRRESVVALIEAQRRIAKDKGGDGRRVSTDTRAAEQAMAQANALAAEGKWPEARTHLDRAYLHVKASVRGMREGDTLVRSLNFANKEEEYVYEVDRNDTHLMLIQVLLQDKPQTARQAQKSVDEAARLRREAETAAALKDYDRGVRTLEDSTRELVRALRGAGIYIPG